MKEPSMVELLMPYAEAVASEDGVLAARLGSLEGATVGIVNNSWRCMDVIADELRRSLGRRGVAGFDERRISAAQVLPEADVAQLAAGCDAVVVGIGN